MTLQAPLAVSWQITHRCNLRCTHCTDYSDAEPSFAACQSLVDDLGREKVFVLSLTGGEPFVRPDLVDLVARAHRWQIMTVIATNGLLVDRPTLAALRANGTSAIAVSLDGADAGTHEARRGPGTFEGAVTALAMIREAGIHPLLSVAVDGSNAHQLRELFDLAIRLRCERVKVQVIFHPQFEPTGRVTYGLALSPLQMQEVLRESRAACARANNLEFVTYCCYTHHLSSMLHPGLPMATCPAGRSKVTILYNGDVILCELTPESIIGNVWTDNFGSIWRAATAQRQFWQATRRYGGACHGCSHQSACRGGCLVLSRQRGAGIWDDPNCLIGNNLETVDGR